MKPCRSDCEPPPRSQEITCVRHHPQLQVVHRTTERAPKQALQLAARVSQSNTHHYVEIEHWLLKLLEPTDGDLPHILRHFGVDSSRVARELNKALEQFRRGRSGNPGFATEVLDMMREGWSLASLEYGVGQLRSAHLLAALIFDRSLPRPAQGVVARAGKDRSGEVAGSLARADARNLRGRRHDTCSQHRGGACARPVGGRLEVARPRPVHH